MTDTPEEETDKQAVRERVWDHLEDAGIARFPFPPHGRIPNFDGARAAADRLDALDEWEDATVVKANPDAPQLPARRNALRAGKTLYMAVPRLRDERCFVELDPARLDDLDAAPTVSHMDEHGTRVGPDALPHVDLVLCGSVAITEAGARIGKGEGFSDLEYAILHDLGAVDDDTTVATTVHDDQVLPTTDVPPPNAHDVPLDVVVTPTRTIHTGATGSPDGVDWDALSEDQIEEMPVLRYLREKR